MEPSTYQSAKYWWRFAAALTSYLVIGWSDGTPGALIPRFEKDFGLTYLQVSFIFVAICAGFITGTFVNEPLYHVLGAFGVRHGHKCIEGRRRMAFSPLRGIALTMSVACLTHMVYFIVPASRPPFYGIVISAWVGGTGQAIIIAQMNGYCASQPRRTSLLLGMLHGTYGLGAMLSPLVSTSLLADGWNWHEFYYISIGLAVANLLFVTMTFLPDRIERHTAVPDEPNPAAEVESEKDPTDPTNGRTERDGAAIAPPIQPKSSMGETLRSRYTWFLAFFLFFYTGLEVSTGGWIVTFIIDVRGADPDKAGYAATGFWAGITVGRVGFGLISAFLHWSTEKHLIHAFLVFSLVMIFIMWFVDSPIAGALAGALLGVAKGPIFPVASMITARLVEPRILMTTLSFVSSISNVGGAAMPFICGAISTSNGVKTLMPILISMCSAMTVAWSCFPSRTGTPGNLRFGLGTIGASKAAGDS